MSICAALEIGSARVDVAALSLVLTICVMELQDDVAAYDPVVQPNVSPYGTHILPAKDPMWLSRSHNIFTDLQKPWFAVTSDYIEHR
jgi:hypothetical protein